MPSIRTVNLVWERKVRGSYAVSRFALDDAGTVALVLPRPLQPRAYDLTRIAVDGSVDVRATFSVETLLELEASAESDAVIGMTSDDLYLINRGAKSRFIPERRIILVDSALSMNGQSVAVGFSDVAGSSFALACGDISGRVSWLREANSPISAVAISAEGSAICQAEECGSILLLSSARSEQWLFEQEEAVHSLACAPCGKFTAYGTGAGGVGVIDAEGTRIWDARLPGDVVSIAISSDGGLCAALMRPAALDAPTHLVVMDGTGQIGWEHEADGRLVGLAVSPNGKYIAASSRDGAHSIYEVVFGQAGSSDQDAALLEQSLRHSDMNDKEFDAVRTVRLLSKAIELKPGEVLACERLLEIRRAYSERLLTEARESCDHDQFAEAMKLLEILKQVSPDNPELYQLLATVREQWGAQEIQLADSCLKCDDAAAAEAHLLGVLAFHPTSLEARRRLAALSARSAEIAEADAARLLAESDAEAALAALERAQAILATKERAERIRIAQIDLEFKAGMQAYDAMRYREAVFQFKKVLARNPNHADARRQLNFAQRFEQDSNEALNDRFGRLE